MRIESIKLSSKRNGNGYLSAHTVSISPKEAAECGLIGKRIIKIIDEEKEQITVKAKHFTVSGEMLDSIAERIVPVKQEEQRIDREFFADDRTRTMPELLNLFQAEYTNRVVRIERNKFCDYLLSLSLENIVDLTLLMYIGRDMDCDMNAYPGEDRFLEFYDRYGYIVNGQSQDTLIRIMLGKTPLLTYLKNGYRLLFAPRGTDIEDLDLQAI